jgi:two-component sensor histidine kinase
MMTIFASLLASAGCYGLSPEFFKSLIMDDLTQRITGLSEVHQMLSGGEWAPLNLGELAERIIQVTVRGAQDDVDVTLDVSPASVYVQAAQAQHLALILSELTTNTLKYGANGRDVVHIAVRITQQDGIVTLTYRNDGPGYPEDVLSLERHSAGLDIIKRSVRKNLRGELTLRNEDGAVTEIRFKSEE